MGLDIVAYKNVEYISIDDNDVDEYGDPRDINVFRLYQSLIEYTEENWPGRTEGITGEYFTYENGYDFCVGSYGGYNSWRNNLARLAGYGSADDVWDRKFKEGPFLELINFSDCEGYIGPVVSAKLYQDFKDNYEKAKLVNDDGWFLRKYEDWMKAFEYASQNGLVLFC